MRQYVSKVIYARKRPPQRLLYEINAESVERDNTETVDEAQYSASFIRVIAFEHYFIP